MRLKLANLFMRPQAGLLKVEADKEGYLLYLKVEGMICDI